MAALHPAPHIVRPKSGTSKNTLIFLHGTSQTGPSFAEPFLSYPFAATSLSAVGSVPASTLGDQLPAFRFVLPTGAPKPTTVFGGRETHAWFDVSSFADRTLNEHLAVPGLRESVLYLSELVRQEVILLRHEEERNEVGENGHGKVFIGGFSQGCAMSIFLLLSGTLDSLPAGSLGGFVGMSGFLPFRRQIEDICNQNLSAELPTVRRQLTRKYVRELISLDTEAAVVDAVPWDIPLQLCHGNQDTKMLPEWGRHMASVLELLGMTPAFAEYEGLGHWWCEDEMRGLALFLSQHRG